MTVDYERFFVMELDGSYTQLFRPMLHVRIIGPSAANPPIRCRLDTGADDVMVPELEAGFLGVVLVEAKRVPIDTLGQRTTAIYERVDLEISDGPTTWRWSARVGFHDSPPQAYVLGHNGFLEHFTATFEGLNRRVSLVPNGTFPPPGSQMP
jgi:hypothetical protein